MARTASIRDLRNRFPAVRRMIETEGEVWVTEGGKPRYRLILHTPAPEAQPESVAYWDRLVSYHPQPLTPEQSRSLHEENRGDR